MALVLNCNGEHVCQPSTSRTALSSKVTQRVSAMQAQESEASVRQVQKIWGRLFFCSSKSHRDRRSISLIQKIHLLRSEYNFLLKLQDKPTEVAALDSSRSSTCATVCRIRACYRGPGAAPSLHDLNRLHILSPSSTANPVARRGAPDRIHGVLHPACDPGYLCSTSRCSPFTRRELYIAQASEHHGAALRLATPAIPNINHENAPPLFLFSALSSFICCAKPLKLGNFLLWEDHEIASWLRVPHDFLLLLKGHQPHALVIVGYFCVLLHQLEWMWWMKNWGTHILSQIYHLLPGPIYKAWLQWPMEQIGFVPFEEKL
ncbi:hypothetical protein AN2695.2 [Aspergillus nidulans FGSC A4]|uniref:Uncharacterized protein n=1 Tax=Emericella nidulans (strain FGSC A4 / ATCC 38163 / CBS 112.46 / NRRL 194 / M139) TaxID=227321 RepID=Q5B9T5_EMENI|nr:hypothetical protein [Aspergillus nidulans FGSC A4]EAA63097.1 hypothetical protein AN2695.2 [Aspergillus nidulans FGSC A4]CBF84194.1 TPA: conserved hypothetical protein [Aspergillus nidulans FGSC A4]|eukprot:XP_660299.1 hypothetical protein AN2695.2 [Aspergillus nidulans FGSC A4]